MLEPPGAKRTIELRADHVLHNGSRIIDARHRFLPLFGLSEHVAHNQAQAARGVETDAKRLGGEELMDARNPERFNRVKIGSCGSVEPVQQDEILTHIADAASARAATLRSQHARDSVALQDRLNGTPAETEDLAATLS